MKKENLKFIGKTSCSGPSTGFESLFIILPLFVFFIVVFPQANSFAGGAGGNNFNNIPGPQGSFPYKPKVLERGPVKKVRTVKKLFVDPANMKVSFDFQNAGIADVIRMIARLSNMNVLIGSNVKGTLTMKMRDVPLKNILSLIMEAYGLGMVKKDGIYYINSSETIAAVVSAEERAEAVSQLKITKIIPINYVSAAGLMSKVKSMLSPEGKVMFDRSLHALIISDIEKNVVKAASLIKRLDKKTPEVEIIAKMVEVSQQYSTQLGINWNGAYSIAASRGANTANPNYLAGQTAPLPSGPGLFINPTAAAPPPTEASPGTFSVGIVNQYASIAATLQAMENLGKVKDIASPKIVVLNNQKANIEKGETIYYPGAAGVGAVATPVAITANLSLNITPHIMANGHVKLIINATNDTPINFSGGAPPTLETQAINSTVIVNNGNTVVLGGVYGTTKSVSNGGIPGLMDIPLLGWLFKSQSVSYSKDELLIFITPRIIKS